MKLLQLDYLGGHGTRGYGRINFEKIEITLAADFTNMQNELNSKLEKIKEFFNDVEKYKVFKDVDV